MDIDTHVLLATIGARPGFVYTAIRKRNIDRVILFTSSRYKQEAIQVKATLEDPETFSISTSIHVVNEFDFSHILQTITEVIAEAMKEHKSKQLTPIFDVCNNGGTGLMRSALILVAYNLGFSSFYVKADMAKKDRQPQEEEIINTSLPELRPAQLSNIQIKIIEYIQKGSEINLTKITEHIKTNSNSATLRHVKPLEASRIITGEYRGRQKLFSLTPSGMLLTHFLVIQKLDAVY